MRRCKKCGEPKPLGAFPRGKRNRGGHRPVCKLCARPPAQTCGYCSRETTNWRYSPDGDGYECSREAQCIAPRQPNHRRLVRLGKDAVLACVERHDWNLSAAAREIGVHDTAFRYFLGVYAPEEWTAARVAGRTRVYRGPGPNDPPVGISKLLEAVQLHHWNLTAASEKLGIHRRALARFLERYAPSEILAARQSGQVRGGGKYKFYDPLALIRAFDRYDGNLARTAQALGCAETTLHDAVQRLIPEHLAQHRARRNAQAEAYKRLGNRPKQDTALHPWRLAERAGFLNAQARRRSAA